MKNIFLLIIFSISINSFAQFASFNLNDITDLEDYNKTLVVFEKIFEIKPKRDVLKEVSTNSFIKTKRYKILKELIKTNSLNLGYTEEILKKQFTIKNKKSNLIVIFKKQKDLFWYINDAYIMQGKKKVYFKEFGFKPLAIEYNFVDFIDAIDDKSITQYCGLAPNGKLPLDFINSNIIQPNENSTLFVNNVIIYENKKIIGLFTLKLVYQKKLNNRKRGWLIDDFIPTIDFEKHSLLIDFLSGNTSKYKLNKKSNYFYDNIRINNKSEGIVSDKKRIVIIQNINVRKFPSTRSKIIGKVRKGEKYEIIDYSLPSTIIINDKEISNKWYKIKINEYLYGWVFGKYVKFIE